MRRRRPPFPPAADEEPAMPTFHLLPSAPKPVAPYSHAVEAGGFVFVTGQLATDPDDDARPMPAGVEAQTAKVMDNLRRVLEGLGLGFADVVSARVFLTDFDRDYATMNACYARHFAAARLPARTTVGVTRLARGGLVEIDMIAARR
jgi:2-iminobutanoate/2-iminopropanoate deaminase